MSFTYRLEKVMDLKQKEKNRVVGEYEKARENFQQKATVLYQQLKKKEQLEANHEHLLKRGMVIRDIQQNQFFLGSLLEKIEETQQVVNEARTEMHMKQQLLVLKNIEVKKYEKMKEKAYQEHIAKEKQEEMKVMDEISIQQYMNQRNR